MPTLSPVNTEIAAYTLLPTQRPTSQMHMGARTSYRKATSTHFYTHISFTSCPHTVTHRHRDTGVHS